MEKLREKKKEKYMTREPKWLFRVSSYLYGEKGGRGTEIPAESNEVTQILHIHGREVLPDTSTVQTLVLSRE